MSNQHGMNRILDALGALTNAAPTPEYFEQYRQEALVEKSDRGAAILIATNLENALQAAIERFLALDSSLRKELFHGETSPMSSFANKVRMGKALRIFGEETHRNLNVIRRIRNAFAHAKIPITFETDAVSAACKLLNPPSLGLDLNSLNIALHSHQWDPGVLAAMPARKRFTVTCENTSSLLIRWMLAGPAEISKDALKVQLPPNYDEIRARQKPLP